MALLLVLIILTHENADAALGLDDVRALQSFSPTNDIDPTPVYLSRSSMDSVLLKFPYLIKKKLREGQEVSRVAQLDWKLVKEDCHHPFVASGVEFVPLLVMHGEDYISLGFPFGQKIR
ncbi:Metallo-hydrolase/oxidoreductase superfamily protein [Euphorbia peplus]|nr:Metallo-hydrolase/oxidoreductase superfamily protein [Euphorbia peplus]